MQVHILERDLDLIGIPQNCLATLVMPSVGLVVVVLHFGNAVVVGGDHVVAAEHADHVPRGCGFHDRQVVDVLLREPSQGRVEVVLGQ